VTVITTIPFAFGLLASCIYAAESRYPAWLKAWLWVGYFALFAGEIRAWWIPYLVRPEPARAARYAVLFGATHRFLPLRNGLAPNTLHVILHAATPAILIGLAAF
jgi:hypothetical protein